MVWTEMTGSGRSRGGTEPPSRRANCRPWSECLRELTTQTPS
ncbi:unnamed protein product [Timema podura]|uniref:Uncharacterized protein n=1 Tax=Timema podura TaxID=61482 RepID=A0ABN7NSY6_TIMPD|nr:unnamed protein product [Timema podura]